jgi:HEAT repeat protein
MHLPHRFSVSAHLVLALAALWAACCPVLLRAQDAPGTDEPLYRGRTLETWLRILDEGTYADMLIAIKAVGEFGPESRPHAKAIAAKLKENKREIRLAAANQLAEWEADAKDAAVDLARSLRDIDPEVGDAAANALKRIGAAAGDDARSEVARTIEDRDGSVRDNAVSVMKAIGWHDGSVGVLAKSLGSKDADVRVTALDAMDDIPVKLAQPLRDKVQTLLTDANGGVRRRAAAAVKRLGPDSTLLPFVAAALEHDNDEIVLSGLRAVESEFHAVAQPLTPKVAALLDHENIRVRREAAFALQALKHRDARAAGVLTEILQSSEFYYRKTSDVVAALGELGPLAKDAVPQILKHFESQQRLNEPQSVSTIGRAIAKIGPDAVKSLAGLLSTRRPDLRVAAAEALESIGPGAEPAVPQLVAALNDAEIDVRVNAARALGNVGPAAKSASEPLTDAMRVARRIVEDNQSRYFIVPDEIAMNLFPVRSSTREAVWLAATAEACWRVTSETAAMQALESMLVDRNDEARDFAIAAIERSVTRPPKSSVPGLASVLKYRVAGYPITPADTANTESRFRRRSGSWQINGADASIINALRILERLGDDAKPASGDIATIAANDPRPEVALAAARAWWRLESASDAAKAAADCLTPDRFVGVADDARRELVRAAVELLTEMGDAAKIALPQILLAYQQSTDEQTSAAIGELLKKLDPAAASDAGVR